VIFGCDDDIVESAQCLAQFFELLLMTDSAEQLLPNNAHQLRPAFHH